MSMDNPVTRIVATIHRTETCVYMIEGAVDAESAVELISTGEYDPVDSNIRHEDIDINSLEVRDV